MVSQIFPQIPLIWDLPVAHQRAFKGVSLKQHQIGLKKYIKPFGLGLIFKAGALQLYGRWTPFLLVARFYIRWSKTVFVSQLALCGCSEPKGGSSQGRKRGLQADISHARSFCPLQCSCGLYRRASTVTYWLESDFSSSYLWHTL